MVKSTLTYQRHATDHGTHLIDHLLQYASLAALNANPIPFYPHGLDQFYLKTPLIYNDGVGQFCFRIIFPCAFLEWAAEGQYSKLT